MATPELADLAHRIGGDFIIAAPYGSLPQLVFSDGTMVPIPLAPGGAAIRYDGAFIYSLGPSEDTFVSAVYLASGQQICDADDGEILSAATTDDGEYEMTVLPMVVSGEEGDPVFTWDPAYIENCMTGERRPGGDLEPFDWPPSQPGEQLEIDDKIVTMDSNLVRTEAEPDPTLTVTIVIEDKATGAILDELKFEGIIYYP